MVGNLRRAGLSDLSRKADDINDRDQEKRDKKWRCVLRAKKEKAALSCDSEIKAATFLRTAACFNFSTVIHDVLTLSSAQPYGTEQT